MDINVCGFTYGGKLSTRSISTEEEEFSWDISSCRHECYEGKEKFKSSEFSFADVTWILFATFNSDFISFGILIEKSSTSVEVFDCCCNISYQNVFSEVLKNFELKFKCGKDIPFIGMKDFFNLETSSDTQLKNILDNAVIVCQFRAKRLADTTYCSEERAEKTRSLVYYDCVYLFLEEDSIYRGKFTNKFISGEEQELIWDVSSCINEPDCKTPLRFMSPDFSFAGGTWYLKTLLRKKAAGFGIDVRKRCSTDEVFDCCCSISLQNFKGKVYERFELKFKCDKTMPLISMRDIYSSRSDTQNELSPKEGVLIICRISSNKQIITESCSRTETSNAGGSSIMESHKLGHLYEQKDERSQIVDFICKVCQDLRQLLQNKEGSDVILQVGDQSFKAQRAILTARSSVFAGMFRHNMKENVTGVVNLEDCDISSFPIFLEFLYCGSTEGISRENVFGLYKSSDKYDLPDLKVKCLEFIKNNLSLETFCDTVRLSLRHSENELLKTTIAFFARNFKEVILTVKWQEFISENPIQANEIFIKALASGSQDN